METKLQRSETIAQQVRHATGVKPKIRRTKTNRKRLQDWRGLIRSSIQKTSYSPLEYSLAGYSSNQLPSFSFDEKTEIAEFLTEIYEQLNPGYLNWVELSSKEIDSIEHYIHRMVERITELFAQENDVKIDFYISPDRFYLSSSIEKNFLIKGINDFSPLSLYYMSRATDIHSFNANHADEIRSIIYANAFLGSIIGYATEIENESRFEGKFGLEREDFVAALIKFIDFRETKEYKEDEEVETTDDPEYLMDNGFSQEEAFALNYMTYLLERLDDETIILDWTMYKSFRERCLHYEKKLFVMIQGTKHDHQIKRIGFRLVRMLEKEMNQLEDNLANRSRIRAYETFIETIKNLLFNDVLKLFLDRFFGRVDFEDSSYIYDRNDRYAIMFDVSYVDEMALRETEDRLMQCGNELPEICVRHKINIEKKFSKKVKIDITRDSNLNEINYINLTYDFIDNFFTKLNSIKP